MIWDILRLAIIALFGLCVGETAWIVRQYLGVVRATRRLLPMHVALIGGSFLGLQAEAVWQTIGRVGDHWFTPYVAINLVLFTMAYLALAFMRRHLTRKRDLARTISPLLQDGNEIP